MNGAPDTDVDLGQKFRNAMRVHADSLTIITARFEGRRFGMAGTSVAALTMAPPALAVRVNRDAPLLLSGHFCVNILNEGDAEFCRIFSTKDPSDRFTTDDWTVDPDGLPILRSAQANIICRVGPTRDFDSHSMVIGMVESVMTMTDAGPAPIG